MSTENNNCTPRLRFPGFTGEWVEKKLGDVLDYEQPTAYLVEDANYQKSGIPVLTAGKTFVLGYTHETEGVYDKLPVIIFDDFVTDSKFVDFPFKAKSSAMKMLRLANGENNLRVVFEAMQLLHYPVKEHKRYWISEYSKQSILLPPTLAEQKKIAECLEELDNLIAAQSQNVDALKQKKKGLMQQLFPQKGEIIPRLRFPGFKGDWIIRSVEDIFKVTRGTVLPMKEVSSMQTKEKPYAVYSSQTLNNGLAGFYKEYLYEDAITWTTDGANAGEVRFRKGKFYCTNVCGVLLSNDGYANECIAAIINSVSKSHVSYVGNPKLMNNVMAKILITIPPTIREQQKISDCLSTLDEEIAAESAKLEALKDHKKGLMQQLFPQPAK